MDPSSEGSWHRAREQKKKHDKLKYAAKIGAATGCTDIGASWVGGVLFISRRHLGRRHAFHTSYMARLIMMLAI